MKDNLYICPKAKECAESFKDECVHVRPHHKVTEPIYAACDETCFYKGCTCIPVEPQPATCPDCGHPAHGKWSCRYTKVISDKDHIIEVCNCEKRTPADLQPEKQAKPFERYDKYEVMKLSDIEKYLMQKQKDELGDIIHTIQEGRRRDGKILCNSYVVVKEGLPYTEQVWKLIEDYETKPQPATCPDCGHLIGEHSNVGCHYRYGAYGNSGYCTCRKSYPADVRDAIADLQPVKHCPNCNGTGILAYCDLCSGTGEKPPTREDFRYMEGLGKQPEGEGFVENLDLQPEKHCDVHTLSGEYCPNMPTKPYMLEGKPINLCYQCYKNCIDGAFGAGLYLNLKPAEQPTSMMTLRKQFGRLLCKIDNAGCLRKNACNPLNCPLTKSCLDALESTVQARDSEVVKEFAEKVIVRISGYKCDHSKLTESQQTVNWWLDRVIESIRAMAGGKE